MNDERWYLIFGILLMVSAASIMWLLGAQLPAAIYAAGLTVLLGLLVYDLLRPI